MRLSSAENFLVRQRPELAEIFGFETRNKYEILRADGSVAGFAAEKRDGLLGFFLRGHLGHWRRFRIEVFGADRQLAFTLHHPFRFFFQRIEMFGPTSAPPTEPGCSPELLGAVQQRFAVFSKSFDVEDRSGRVVLAVRSPLFSPWTFRFLRGEQERARVSKKWSGLFSEAFTDRDNFAIQFTDPTLSEEERRLILAAALFIDLQYFERRAR